MLNYLRKGSILNFVQVYDSDNNPGIKCYNPSDESWAEENKNPIGYGKISITANNIIHVWGKNINQEHINKYKKLRKGLLKIVTD